EARGNRGWPEFAADHCYNSDYCRSKYRCCSCGCGVPEKNTENGPTRQETIELRHEIEMPMEHISHQNGNSTVTAPDEKAPMLPAQQKKPEH
ncbi:hypothetical protein BaRGS_00029166, partial [Batillaria attramentaria]